MAILATNESTGGNFELVPAGNHVARCYLMIHIGTVVENIPGKGTKTLNKLHVKFELPEEMRSFKDGEAEKPMSIGKDLTLSMNEKSNLRKLLESWRGKAFTEEEAKSFDVTKVLGAPCLLNVIHKVSAGGKPYAEISSITPVPKSMKAPDMVNQKFEFNYTPFNVDQFNKIPEWIQKKMKTSVEYLKATGQSPVLTKEQEDQLQGIEFERQRLAVLAASGKGPNDDLPF